MGLLVEPPRGLVVDVPARRQQVRHMQRGVGGVPVTMSLSFTAVGA